MQKRVLMFCTAFFGYDKRIAGALREEGFEVDLFDERPGQDFVSKAAIRFNVKGFRPVVLRYIQSVIDSAQPEYDYVFVVKGEAICEEAITLLRKAYPGAEFILYLWDSIANIPDCKKRIPLYDRVLTFDPEDAKEQHLPYLPLPYNNNSFSYPPQNRFEYDVAFVGTAHSVRPKVVKQIVEQCEKMGRKAFVFFYSPHPLVYLYHKLRNPNFRYISLKEIHFKPLSSEELHRVYQSSRCVLDIEHPDQNGTTTRPIEMLPMQKKIITTNQHVRLFPFYNENNFCVIDRKQVCLDERFFDLPYIPPEKSIMDRYSPSHFVRSIFKSDGVDCSENEV